MKDKVSLTIHIEKKIRKDLDKLALQEERSLSNLVNRILREVVKEQLKK